MFHLVIYYEFVDYIRKNLKLILGISTKNYDRYNHIYLVAP